MSILNNLFGKSEDQKRKEIDDFNMRNDRVQKCYNCGSSYSSSTPCNCIEVIKEYKNRGGNDGSNVPDKYHSR